MFDIGWSEFLLIGIVAILVIGPKDMPKVVKQVAKWLRAARKVAREFQHQVDDVLQAEELQNMKKELEKHGITDFKDQIQRELEYTSKQLNQSLAEPKPDQPSASEPQIPKIS